VDTLASTGQPLSERAPVPAPKVRIPTASTALVMRPRLLELVGECNTEGPGPDLTFLCAPAGSGKTSLLAEWARRRRKRGDAIAWVSLEAGDNDVHLLWSAILVSINASCRWPDGSSLPGIGAPRSGMSPAFLSAFDEAVNELPQPVYLVLDDVHELYDLAALQSVDMFLRSLPSRLRVVMAGRFTPALALPRLRLEGRLSEIGASQLAFTPPEASTLLGAHGVQLDPDDLQVLLARTEGWAAGLRLAAMSLARREDRSALIANFASNDRAVADYLVGEVLARQEESIREFLLTTCVSEGLTADLARELSGREDSGAVLDELERSNSFIVRLGGRGDWYRYHPMLREYLRGELARQHHDRVRVLHRAAAQWFAGRRDTMAAIDHAIEAADPDLTATLLEASGLQHVMRGEGAKLRRLLSHASDDVAQRPGVALVAAAAALEAGDPVAADVALARMRPAIGLTGHGAGDDPVDIGEHDAGGSSARSLRMPALNAAIALQRARLSGDISSATEVLATEGAITGDPDLDVLTHINRGATLAWMGDIDAGEADLRQALAMATATGRDWVALQCMTYLASVACARMDMVAVDRQAREATAFAAQRGWTRSLPYFGASLALGWAAYQRMDDATVAEAHQALHLVKESHDPVAKLAVRLFDAIIAFDDAENRHGVESMRSAWEHHGARHTPPSMVAAAALIEQRMALQVGEPTWAGEVVERAGRFLGETGELRVLQAVLQAYRGRTESARRLLGPVLADELPSVTPLARVEAWIWEARLADRAGEVQRAHAAVVEAVHVGAPRELLRPFVGGGQEIRDLLARSGGRFGRFEGFVARIRAGFTPSIQEGIESLTTRELELLVELPSLRTADEIAASLFVSVNTVKTHLRGIYRKLGVNSRREAIVLARRRGML
jgi:LuxR family maltose regulon positive regulatory protein